MEGELATFVVEFIGEEGEPLWRCGQPVVVTHTSPTRRTPLWWNSGLHLRLRVLHLVPLILTPLLACFALIFILYLV